MSATLDKTLLDETVKRVEKRRSVQFEWEIGEQGEKTLLAVLTVSHHKAGYNLWTYEHFDEDYFSVSLGREAEEKRPTGFTVRSFRVFSALGLMRIPAGNRYSAKKLREAAETGYAEFKKLYEAGDPRVMIFFDPDYTGADTR